MNVCGRARYNKSFDRSAGSMFVCIHQSRSRPVNSVVMPRLPTQPASLRRRAKLPPLDFANALIDCLLLVSPLLALICNHSPLIAIALIWPGLDCQYLDCHQCFLFSLVPVASVAAA